MIASCLPTTGAWRGPLWATADVALYRSPVRLRPRGRAGHSGLTAEHAIGGPRAAEKAWEEIERAFRDNAEPYDVVPPGLRHAFNQLARVAQSG
jgi:hypothetical protein